MPEKSDGLIKYESLNTHYGKRYIMINCFVLGNGASFTFDIKDEKNSDVVTFSHFREKLVESKRNVFGEAKAEDLKLWRVNIHTRRNKEYEELKENPHLDIDIGKKFGGEVLDTTWNIIKEFPNPTEEHIHIIVRPPPPATTGKRRLEEDEDEEDESQAKKGKLIDQELIRDLIKDLKNIDTSQPNFILPPLPRSERLIVYNRKCYKYFLDFILNDDGNSYCRYYISGNPGIGKTYFGRLMLIELLKRGKKVLMDYRGFTALIDPTAPKNFLQEVRDEYQFGQIAQQNDIWCIIDGVAPKVGHDFDGGKLILVSSPRKEIVGSFMKHQNRKKFVMPTWKDEEIDEYWRQIHENKTRVTLGSLKEKFKLCGGIARWVFDTKMTLDDIKSNILSAITSIDAKILNFQGQEVRGEELTHRLIHIHTNLPLVDNEDPDPYTKSIFYFASEQITNLCLEKLKKDDNERLRKFMENAKGISEMGSLRGQLFEMICHIILRSGKDFRVRNLLDGREESKKNFGVLEEEFYDKVTEINVNGNYYRPYSKTSKSVDSYIHYNQLFQITVAKRHGIKQKGIKNFENILNKSDEIRLYFAVPKDIFESFTKQNYMDGDKKAVTVENWINAIEQYSLCVDLDQFLISDYHI